MERPGLALPAAQPRRNCGDGPLCAARRPCALHRRLDEGIGLIESLFRRTTLDQLIPPENAGV
jgi:hypothetical protein